MVAWDLARALAKPSDDGKRWEICGKTMENVGKIIEILEISMVSIGGKVGNIEEHGDFNGFHRGKGWEHRRK